VISAFTKALEDPNEKVRAFAQEVLKRIQEKEGARLGGGERGLLDRKLPNSNPEILDDHNRGNNISLTVAVKKSFEMIMDKLWSGMPHPKKDHSGFIGLPVGENGGEIKIHGQQDSSFFERAVENIRILTSRHTEVSDMNSVKPLVFEPVSGAGRDRYIEKKFHWIKLLSGDGKRFFVGQPSGIFENFMNVFLLQVWIIGQYLIRLLTSSQKIQNQMDRNPEPPDTSLTTKNRRINRDSLKVSHGNPKSTIFPKTSQTAVDFIGSRLAENITPQSKLLLPEEDVLTSLEALFQALSPNPGSSIYLEFQTTTLKHYQDLKELGFETDTKEEPKPNTIAMDLLLKSHPTQATVDRQNKTLTLSNKDLSLTFTLNKEWRTYSDTLRKIENLGSTDPETPGPTPQELKKALEALKTFLVQESILLSKQSKDTLPFEAVFTFPDNKQKILKLFSGDFSRINFLSRRQNFDFKSSFEKQISDLLDLRNSISNRLQSRIFPERGTTVSIDKLYIEWESLQSDLDNTLKSPLSSRSMEKLKMLLETLRAFSNDLGVTIEIQKKLDKLRENVAYFVYGFDSPDSGFESPGIVLIKEKVANLVKPYEERTHWRLSETEKGAIEALEKELQQILIEEQAKLTERKRGRHDQIFPHLIIIKRVMKKFHQLLEADIFPFYRRYDHDAFGDIEKIRGLFGKFESLINSFQNPDFSKMEKSIKILSKEKSEILNQILSEVKNLFHKNRNRSEKPGWWIELTAYGDNRLLVEMVFLGRSLITKWINSQGGFHRIGLQYAIHACYGAIDFYLNLYKKEGPVVDAYNVLKIAEKLTRQKHALIFKEVSSGGENERKAIGLWIDRLDRDGSALFDKTLSEIDHSKDAKRWDFDTLESLELFFKNQVITLPLFTLFVLNSSLLRNLGSLDIQTKANTQTVVVKQAAEKFQGTFTSPIKKNFWEKLLKREKILFLNTLFFLYLAFSHFYYLHRKNHSSREKGDTKNLSSYTTQHTENAIQKTTQDLEQFKKNILESSKAIERNLGNEAFYVRRGSDYLKLGQLEKAIEDYTKFIETYPLAPQGYFLRGFCYFRLNQFEKSIQDFTKSIELNLNEPGYYQVRGDAYFKLGYLKEAEEDFSKAMILDSKCLLDWFSLGEARFELSQFNEAIEDYSQEIKLHPSHSLAYFKRAFSYFRLDQYQKAFEDITSAINLDPHDFSNYWLRGAIYSKLKRPEEALRDFLKVLELEPNFAKAEQIITKDSFPKLAPFVEILVNASKAIKLDPKNAKAYQDRGGAYLEFEKFESAHRDLSTAIDLGASNAGVYHLLGLVCSKLNYLSETIAINHFSRAIELDPTVAQIYHDRGVAYLNFKKPEREKALEDFSKAIGLDPLHARAHLFRGLVYKYREEFDKALVDFTRAIELDPKHDSNYLYRGDVYLDLGQIEKAVEDYSKAIKFTPESVKAHYGRGNANVKLGRLQEAVEDFSKAIELDPSHWRAYNDRGYVYFKLYKFGGAFNNWWCSSWLNPRSDNYAFLLLTSPIWLVWGFVAGFFGLRLLKKSRGVFQKSQNSILKEEEKQNGTSLSENPQLGPRPDIRQPGEKQDSTARLIANSGDTQLNSNSDDGSRLGKEEKDAVKKRLDPFNAGAKLAASTPEESRLENLTISEALSRRNTWALNHLLVRLGRNLGKNDVDDLLKVLSYPDDIQLRVDAMKLLEKIAFDLISRMNDQDIQDQDRKKASKDLDDFITATFLPIARAWNEDVLKPHAKSVLTLFFKSYFASYGNLKLEEVELGGDSGKQSELMPNLIGIYLAFEEKTEELAKKDQRRMLPLANQFLKNHKLDSIYHAMGVHLLKKDLERSPYYVELMIHRNDHGMRLLAGARMVGENEIEVRNLAEITIQSLLERLQSDGARLAEKSGKRPEVRGKRKYQDGRSVPAGLVGRAQLATFFSEVFRPLPNAFAGEIAVAEGPGVLVYEGKKNGDIVVVEDKETGHKEAIDIGETLSKERVQPIPASYDLVYREDLTRKIQELADQNAVWRNQIGQIQTPQVQIIHVDSFRSSNPKLTERVLEDLILESDKRMGSGNLSTIFEIEDPSFEILVRDTLRNLPLKRPKQFYFGAPEDFRNQEGLVWVHTTTKDFYLKNQNRLKAAYSGDNHLWPVLDNLESISAQDRRYKVSVFNIGAVLDFQQLAAEDRGEAYQFFIQKHPNYAGMTLQDFEAYLKGDKQAVERFSFQPSFEEDLRDALKLYVLQRTISTNV
jgi:tetratricopeptide (TPR) repeat protein